MGEEELKKVENETPSTESAPHPVTSEEVPKDVSEEKAVCPPSEEKVDDSKALAIVEKEPDTEVERISSHVSHERDAALARVETEKRISLIKAWEDSEKTKAENKALKKLSTIGSWENSKKATVEAELKKMEEKLEKKKGEYIEKMQNKICSLHKEAEEKRAMVEAKRGEELLKAEETAAKYRATGYAPKKLFGCFS